jgi:hypothetical protein
MNCKLQRCEIEENKADFKVLKKPTEKRKVIERCEISIHHSSL